MNKLENTWQSQIQKIENSNSLRPQEEAFIHHLECKLIVDLETLSEDEISHLNEIVEEYLPDDKFIE